MANFGRALQIALTFRWTIAVAFFCSLMVALLWGANVTTVYPFIEVVFRRKSMQTWVDERIDQTKQKIDQHEAEIARLVQADDPGAASIERSKRGLETSALSFYQWLRPVIFRFLPKNPFPTLLWVVGFLLVGTLLKDAFLVCQQILVTRVVGLTTLELRQRFYRHVLKMDMAMLGKDRTGKLMSRFTTDLSQVVGGVNVLLGDAIREPLKMIVCFCGAAFISWRLLLFSLILSPIALFFMSRLAKRIKQTLKRSLEETGALYSRLAETFGGILLVKAFSRERYERRRFRQAAKQLYRRQMQTAFLSAWAKPNTELMGIAVICLALLAGGYLVLNEKTAILGIPLAARPMTLGALMAFFAFLAGVSDPARKLTGIYNDLARGVVAADRLFAMLDGEPTVRDPDSPRPMPAQHAELIFDSVTFEYLPGQPVLKDLSLKIPFGQCVAIVGPNGCGKSTLANLILRFYDPTSGSVRLDYTDLKSVRQRDLRSIIGIVTQQPHLFDESILENIRYGSHGAAKDQVIRAAQQAHAHRFVIESLENGYHTNVGERGGRLSGGQRQRIALARAILRDPQIFILDEATSQVDPESELLIHKALAEFIRGRTTIMITHRLSTLDLADRILVMDSGRIIGDGRHHELLETCDLYRRLHQTSLRESA